MHGSRSRRPSRTRQDSSARTLAAAARNSSEPLFHTIGENFRRHVFACDNDSGTLDTDIYLWLTHSPCDLMGILERASHPLGDLADGVPGKVQRADLVCFRYHCGILRKPLTPVY